MSVRLWNRTFKCFYSKLHHLSHLSLFMLLRQGDSVASLSIQSPMGMHCVVAWRAPPKNPDCVSRRRVVTWRHGLWLVWFRDNNEEDLWKRSLSNRFADICKIVKVHFLFVALPKQCGKFPFSTSTGSVVGPTTSSNIFACASTFRAATFVVQYQ